MPYSQEEKENDIAPTLEGRGCVNCEHTRLFCSDCLRNARNKKMMHNQTAAKKYIETQLKIKAELQKLQAALDTHNAQAVNVHWGHVGDVQHILSQLKELNEEEE